ncbi:hydrogenase maturation protease [Sulfurisphaera ohwakuensis]|uniref:Hydrogenase maturation protease n=1 Tax=Sulfurisphaera ohwakuensis TaxID=69656 RepID=A0A650CGE8_SULOH|nr:hydrogenase maturation protease [Sulfurisphaera ohwakuensis]MBB5252717.1 hydrogenase maturation protease [Sulfurisphaera ohwakuensis]QGR16863.1 hydrogenase maturation protease [Sulfurisphaera ohwakuensis]
MAVKIIGLGNRLYGDDAIGSITAECMGVYDASANGFDALTFIEKGDIVIFLDTMLMEEEYGLFEINKDKIQGVEISDAHRLSPIQIVSLAKQSGREPQKVYIMAVKPERLDWPGISAEVIERMRKLLSEYSDFLKKLGLHVNVDNVIQCVKSRKDSPW